MRKYIYVKAKDTYGGHQEGEVIRLRNKVPPHLKDHVTEVSQKTYDNYVKGVKEEDEVIDQEVAELVAEDQVENSGGMKTGQPRKGSGNSKK